MWKDTLQRMLFKTKAVRFDTYLPPTREGAPMRLRKGRRPRSRDYDLNLWMNEMYEWGVRVREDIQDLESLLTPVQYRQLRALKRGHHRVHPDPGDPPPPPKPGE